MHNGEMGKVRVWVTVAVISGTLVSCNPSSRPNGLKSGKAAPTTSLTAPTTTTSLTATATTAPTITATNFQQIPASPGQTITMTAVLYGTPDFPATLNLTFDRVVDPHPPSSSSHEVATSFTGARRVELVFTVTNTGSTFPADSRYLNERGSLQLTFAVNAPLIPVTGPYRAPFATSEFGSAIPYVAGTSVTDSTSFEIPNSLKIMTVAAILQWETGSGPGPAIAEWLVK
jgi:hypothetical protein